MSNKFVLLTALYLASLIPFGICLPQNCPCGKSQHTYSGPLQFVLARPWSGYRVDSPTYLPFPLVISRGTREIKSALESPEEADKKLKTDVIGLADDKDAEAHDNIKPRSLTSQVAADKVSKEFPVVRKTEKEEEEIPSGGGEEEESSDEQTELDRLNLLGQLFQVLAYQYQKVFGGQNNLRGTNSTLVKSDEGQDDYGDYSYDSLPRTQIDRPETEQEVAKKEKRKAEEETVREEKDTGKLQRVNHNSTTTAKSSG